MERKNIHIKNAACLINFVIAIKIKEFWKLQINQKAMKALQC